MKKKVSVLLLMAAVLLLGIAIAAKWYNYASEVYLLCIPICVIGSVLVRFLEKRELLYLGAALICCALFMAYILTGHFSFLLLSAVGVLAVLITFNRQWVLRVLSARKTSDE